MRPFDKVENLNHLIQPPDKYSFPSGHTAAAFLVAAILSHQFSDLTSVLYIWAILTGISRIYLRVHFPTDVLFGIILGLYSAQFGLWIVF
jgi:undecaprenyl-diphosphatase